MSLLLDKKLLHLVISGRCEHETKFLKHYMISMLHGSDLQSAMSQKAVIHLDLFFPKWFNNNNRCADLISNQSDRIVCDVIVRRYLVISLNFLNLFFILFLLCHIMVSLLPEN